MKKITIITMSLLLFAGGLSFAQSTKYKTRAGIVKESTMETDKNGKSKKIPLKGVIIETNEQARATSSDNGTFKLNISKAPFKITKAEKKDYMMLIPEAGKTTYNDGKDIINILLVKKNNMNSRVGSQTKTATENNEKKKNESLSELEKRKDRGEITTSEYIRMHDSITKVYSDRLKTLIDYCEESAKRWFIGQEIIDQQIDDAIIKGENDKALSLIDSKGTTKQRTEEIEKSKAAYENHKKLAQQHDEIAEKHKEVYESKVKSLVQDYWKKSDIKLMEVKYSEALTYLDSARVLQEEHFGLQDPDLARTYNEIGTVYCDQGNPDAAMKWLNKALKIREQVLDPMSIDLAGVYINIGNAYNEKRNHDEALKYYENALLIEKYVLDSLDPNLASLYNNIGTIYTRKKNYKLAITYYVEALIIQSQILNPWDPVLSHTYNNIGAVCCEAKFYDEAMKWLNKALVIQEQVLYPLHPSLASTYSNIGSVYRDQGKPDEALKWYNKSLQIREQVLDPLSPDLAKLYNHIGIVYVNQEKLEKALEYFNKSLPGLIKNYGEEDEIVILTMMMIIGIEKNLGK